MLLCICAGKNLKACKVWFLLLGSFLKLIIKVSGLGGIFSDYKLLNK